MNSKKLLVVFLLILTVILGLVAVYMIANLTVPTGTSDVVTIVPASATATPTVTPVGSAKCGESCTGVSCDEDSTCLVVSGVRRCVSLSCVDKEGTTAVINDDCGADYCINTDNTPTVKPTLTIATTKTTTATPTTTKKVTTSPSPTTVQAVTVTKSSTVACDYSGTIKIILTNSGSSSVVYKVTEDLTTSFAVSYIKASTISNSGTVSNSSIVWDTVSIPAKGSTTLAYKFTMPANENGKTYTNNIKITSSDTGKTSTTSASITLKLLPCTALDADQIEMIIIGLALMILGTFAFKMQWHQSIGNYFWSHGLSEYYGKFSSATHYAGIALSGLLKRVRIWESEKDLSSKEKFEKHIVDSKDNK